ncbi:MAG TPA: porin family protein [Hanamia sp.]|nr:porin family protein [Hanamia sp.]
MKKTIIFAATLFALCSVKAQSAHFGIKGGLNASSVNSSPSNSDMQTKIGFNLGLLAHIHTSNPQWAIQPEIYYSDEGAKSKSNSSASLNLGFINVPVLAQYMFDNGFRIEAGPQVGFLMNAKSKSGNVSVNVKDNFKKANFSIPVGLGYLASSGLGFDARYNFGISNINNTSSSTKIHSNVFQFGLFYQFSDTKRHH